MKFHRIRYDMTEFTTLNMKIVIFVYTDHKSQTVVSLSRSIIDHAKSCLGSSFVIRKVCLDAVTAKFGRKVHTIRYYGIALK